MKEPILFVMIGPPACGKSTLANSILESGMFEPVWIVSTDSIRKEFFGDEGDQSCNDYVFDVAYNRISRIGMDNQVHVCLQKSAIFDATNCKSVFRRKFISEVSKGFGLVIGIVYGGELDDCLEKNQDRDRKVPDKVIKKMYENLKSEPPSLDEGFDFLVSMDSFKSMFLNH